MARPKERAPVDLPVQPLGNADRALAESAQRKRAAGERPTRMESEALRRQQKAMEEAARWHVYRTIPQKHWEKLSGRPRSVLVRQASLYDIPFGGPVVDLQVVARAMHNLLADRGQALLREERAGGYGGASLERFRDIKARREELLLERDLGKWLPRDEVTALLARLAQTIRRAGDALQRQFGVEAHRILDEALDEYERQFQNALGNNGQAGEAEPS